MDRRLAVGHGLIRQARLAESLTIAWMLVELVVALWAGIAARSVALTAFGVDSGIELVTAPVVLRQLLLHTDRATEEELDARERQSSRIVGWALYGLIAYIVASSAWSLEPRGQNADLQGFHPGSGPGKDTMVANELDTSDSSSSSSPRR